MQSACAVLYCHLWPVRLYHISPHNLIKGTIFRKKLLNKKKSFAFLQLLYVTILTIMSPVLDIGLYVWNAQGNMYLLPVTKHCRPVRVGFVADKVAQEQLSLPVLRLSSATRAA